MAEPGPASCLLLLRFVRYAGPSHRGRAAGIFARDRAPIRNPRALVTEASRDRRQVAPPCACTPSPLPPSRVWCFRSCSRCSRLFSHRPAPKSCGPTWARTIGSRRRIGARDCPWGPRLLTSTMAAPPRSPPPAHWQAFFKSADLAAALWSSAAPARCPLLPSALVAWWAPSVSPKSAPGLGRIPAFNTWAVQATARWPSAAPARCPPRMAALVPTRAGWASSRSLAGTGRIRAVSTSAGRAPARSPSAAPAPCPMRRATLVTTPAVSASSKSAVAPGRIRPGSTSALMETAPWLSAAPARWPTWMAHRLLIRFSRPGPS